MLGCPKIVKLFTTSTTGETFTYPSEDNSIPWTTDFSALAATPSTQIANPNKWKLGSPYNSVKSDVKRSAEHRKIILQYTNKT